MAWIESHQELGRHPKTKKLARLLDISLPSAVGHLQFLWWWALDFAKDGDLSRYEAADIADAGLWEEDSEVFQKALIDAGYLDLTEDGILIHDWYDYAGRLLEKRADDAERKKQARQKKDVQKMSNGRPTDGARNRTVPNLTINNNTPNAREDELDETTTFSRNAFDNPHENRIHIFCNEYELDSINLHTLDGLFAFIGKVDMEVIEYAIKKAHKRHVNYAVNTLKGLAKEGKTTKESLFDIEIGLTKSRREKPGKTINGHGNLVVVSEEERSRLNEIRRKQAERNQASGPP